ncbi:hypothetical protein [Streptomyces sp. MB09-02B]|uniref:hypothetical protein n=1 Tax=Streptomyces sp. MB09-02B TaxID=3028667 RepID=UPI0029A394C0|nr:hypothetical protein [Streptomyces sp. MB09-02B]MDX3638638.1 hypothetical protein [Streptomyces sp. MB09-02B]
MDQPAREPHDVPCHEDRLSAEPGSEDAEKLELLELLELLAVVGTQSLTAE